MKTAFCFLLMVVISMGCQFTSRFPFNKSINPISIVPQNIAIPEVETDNPSLEATVKNPVSYMPGETKTDITYCTMDGNDLKMDLYFPLISPDSPFPVVMYVHGGAWQKGDKNDATISREIPILQEEGFLVVSINYRLAPKYQFPAQMQDAKCAVRFLRAHAHEYNLNPEKIGVWGGSAGGHLVSLLGVADPSAGWDVGEYLDQSSQVQAVIDMFGPSDLTIQFAGNGPLIWRNVFGVNNLSDPKLAAASPVTYVTPQSPPFLILHGEDDNLVPLEQSQILFEKLKEAGVPIELVIVQNAGHGFTPTDKKSISPSRQELGGIIANFMFENLK